MRIALERRGDDSVRATIVSMRVRADAACAGSAGVVA